MSIFYLNILSIEYLILKIVTWVPNFSHKFPNLAKKHNVSHVKLSSF